MPRFSSDSAAIQDISNQLYSTSIQPNQTPAPAKWNSKIVNPENNNTETFVSNSTNRSLLKIIKRKITNSNQKTNSKKHSKSDLTAKQNKENKKIFFAEIMDHMSKFIGIPSKNLRYIDIRLDPSEIETEILNYLIRKGYSSDALQTKIKSLKQKDGSKGLDYLLSKLTTKLIENPNQYLIKNPACQKHPDIDASQVESATKTAEIKNISDFEIHITKAYACMHPHKKIFITQNSFSLGVNHLYNNNNLPINDACNKALDIANKSRTAYDFISYINSSEQNQHLLAENDQKDKYTTNHIQQTINTSEIAEATTEIPTSENISLSPMTNFSNTCWCNAAFKFMLHYFGANSIKESINKKLHTCDTRTIIGMHTATVLNNLNIIFDDLSNHEPISKQIRNLFIAINNYVLDVETPCSEDDFIKDIFQFISPAFSRQGQHPEFTAIRQEDSEAFFLHLSNLLGLVNDANKIHYKKIKQFTFNNSDLKAIGVSLTNDPLILDIEYPEDILFIRTMNNEESHIPEAEEITVKTFVEYLSRSTNTQYSKQELLNMAQHAKKYDENIKISCKSVFKKTAPIVDMQQFTDFVLNVDSRHYNNNRYIRDIEKIKTFVVQAFQQSKMEVIDQNTQQKHIINTQPSTLIMRKGTGSFGHYMTISIDSKQNFWVHNDEFNDTLENVFINTVIGCDKSEALADFKRKTPLDQLLAFMDKRKAYPTSIGFFVV
jgi:hypothetical protein